MYAAKVCNVKWILWSMIFRMCFDLFAVCAVKFQFFISLSYYHYYYYYHYYFVCVHFIDQFFLIVSACLSCFFWMDTLGFFLWRIVWNIHVLFSLRRRITCRKGEVQGCQRRTRHDIERIVGLLSNEINLFWWWWWRQLQEAFFLHVFPLLSIIPLIPLCEFICAQQWQQYNRCFFSSTSVFYYRKKTIVFFSFY
jgi:hypothetical protein